MRLTCIVCYEALLASESINAAPCGHILHYHCWVGWLERTHNCPECRKTTRPEQLIKLYFNTGEGDDYTTLRNKYDALKCELQCKMTEIKAAHKLLRSQKTDIDSLETNIKKWKSKVRELERFQYLEEESNSHFKDSKLEKYWVEKLENKDAEIRECQLQAKQHKDEKSQRESASSMTAEEKRKQELRRLPRGCVLRISDIPPHWRGDHPSIRREFEHHGGRVAFVTYKRGDSEAFVRLQKGGAANPAKKFVMGLPMGGIIIDQNLFYPSVLQGQEETDFLKQSLEDRDRRQLELRKREKRNTAVEVFPVPIANEPVLAESAEDPLSVKEIVANVWRYFTTSPM